MSSFFLIFIPDSDQAGGLLLSGSKVDIEWAKVLFIKISRSNSINIRKRINTKTTDIRDWEEKR